MKSYISQVMGVYWNRKKLFGGALLGLIILLFFFRLGYDNADVVGETIEQVKVAGIRDEALFADDIVSAATPSSSPTATSAPIATSTPTSTPNSNENTGGNSNPTPSLTNSPTPSPTATPTPTPSPTPSPSPTSSPSPTPMNSPGPVATNPPVGAEVSVEVGYSVKVLNIFFIPSSVSPVYNPAELSNSLVNGMRESSNNKVRYNLVDTRTVDRSTTKNSSGRMDYSVFLDEFDVCNRLNSGEIDEVWIWVNGGDGAGFEYTASGPNVSDPYSGMKSCGKNLFVMGFDYTRTYDLAMHSMGHRFEFTSKRFYNNDYLAWDGRDHRYAQSGIVPLEDGVVGCGNVHFPPNATSHYDYSNSAQVQSDCVGSVQTITCSAWGCSQEGFMKWWFKHSPSHWWEAFAARV